MAKVVDFKNIEKSLTSINLNEMEDIVRKSRKESINILNHFLDILGLDKDIMKVIKWERIIIDFNMDEKTEGCHYFDNNNTGLNGNKLKKDLDNITDETDFKYLSIDLILLLLHEYIHSFRDFLFKYDESSIEQLDNYDEMYSKYSSLIKRNNQLLSIKEDNDSYSLTIYYYGKFIIKTIKKEDLPNNNLYTFLKQFNNRHPYIKGEIEYIYPANNFSNNFAFINKNKYKGIEEVLVDCFAYIVYHHKNRDSYDESVSTKLKEKDEYGSLLKLGFEIISKMSIDDIKWFFSSYMLDEYNDRIQYIYDDKYEELLDLLNTLYNMYTDETEVLYIPEEYERCLALLESGGSLCLK